MRKVIKALVTDEGVIVKKEDLTQKILKWIKKGFENYVLIPPLPSLYLLENGIIEVYDSDLRLDFEELTRRFLEKDPFILTKYVVFRDLAIRGYYIEDYINNEMIILRGKKDIKEHEIIYFIILEEGKNIEINKLNNIIQSKKILEENNKFIVACVERRGNVTYYEVKIFRR